MRLLNTSSLQFEDFNHEATPEYAILSHRWQDGELTHQDFLNGHQTGQQGHDKVLEACRLAESRSRDYIWIDSICIDKKSSAELSEAINAMFNWYKDAIECYAFLVDVPPAKHNMANYRDPDSPDLEAFANSRWFSRGWCLQELLAPKQVMFYNNAWQPIGTKKAMAPTISKITGIDIEILRHPERVFHVNVAQRMSWASGRQTTRSEDIAYCLLGIFDVNMALLYGEGGKKAFFRLQLEIIKNTNDDSIFAWMIPDLPVSGMLAPWPSAFAESGDIRTFARPQQGYQRPYSWTNLGLELWIPDFEQPTLREPRERRLSHSQGQERAQDTLFGRDLETFTLSCWKSKKPGEVSDHQGWRWRDRVIRVHLKRHGAAWRRVNCNEFLLGVGKEHVVAQDSTDATTAWSKPTHPVSYRLVYVMADTWEPYSSKLRLAGATPTHDADVQASIEESWEKCNLLTLDGSDLRSYWSLLALNKLVECIAEEEENHTEPHYHSFQPEPYPNDVAKASSPAELALLTHYSGYAGESFKALKSTRRFLLCHYFDCIGGSSFGGLIAIMLGRLHMAICDCIAEFGRLDREIFQTSKPFMKRKPKYEASKLEEFMESVSEKSTWNWFRNGSLKFESKSRTCRTFVTAIESAEVDRDFRKVHVLRSYTNTLMDRSPSPGPQTNRFLLMEKSRPVLEDSQLKPLVGTNVEAPRLKIGRVSWAATASPGYFEPLTLKGNKYKVLFEHGGFGFPINPTLFGMREIDTSTGISSAGTVVSVGTTTQDSESNDPLSQSLGPNRTHRAVDAAAKHDGFEYYRIDPDAEETPYHVVPMLPNEWDFNGKSGWKTKTGIETVFNRWLENPDVQNYFTECAQSLVGRRRMRTQNRARWARFSTGTEFRCPLKHDFDTDPCWSDSEEFADHLRDKHELEGEKLENQIDRVVQAYRRSHDANPQRATQTTGDHKRADRLEVFTEWSSWSSSRQSS